MYVYCLKRKDGKESCLPHTTPSPLEGVEFVCRNVEEGEDYNAFFFRRKSSALGEL